MGMTQKLKLSLVVATVLVALALAITLTHGFQPVLIAPGPVVPISPL
jgi:hypothetical protein